MKKICTRCGNPLNMAERQCTCGAFNPFYIASFKSPQSLNLEIDAIEEELHPQLAVEPQADEKPAIEMMDRERAIRETAETGLKQEILRVKDETEQYKKQTFEMVKEVREELHQIDEENKRLKQEVEMLNQKRAPQPVPVSETSNSQPVKKAEKRFFSAIAICLIVFCAGLGYFLTIHKNYVPPSPIVKSPPVIIQPKKQEQEIVPVDTTSVAETNKDTVPVKKLIAMATPPVTAKPVPVAQPAQKASPPIASPITETRVMDDMLGNKLSGCGITVNNPGEIANFSNLTLITREPSGEAKYKFTARIVQGGEIYYATPYIYYDANGVFVKIDGTNCE